VQLREYWDIIRRRLWLVLLLPVVAVGASGYLAFRGPSAYCANMKLAVGIIPEPREGSTYKYDLYYPWLASEYLADDLTEVLKSQAFAQDVSAELGYSLDPPLAASATRAKKTHRTIDLAVCGQDRGVVAEVGNAYERVLNTRLGEYFRQLQAQNGQVRIINRPTIERASSTGSLAAELALRGMLGLALGLGLAFLLHYLDDRMRDRRELERLLDLPTLGEIPSYRQLAPR
jgi:capsular polysaccharide biosynthesis protein